MNTYSYKKYGLILVASFIISTNLFSGVYAQVGNLDRGDKIRIYAPSIEFDLIYGTINNVSPTAIYLISKGSNLSVPIDAIQRLELENGFRRNTGRGAFIGVLSGGALGGLIGLMSEEGCGTNESFCFEFSPGLYFLGGAAVGGLSGLVVGAIIGSLVKTTRWREIPINMKIGFNSLPHANATLSSGITLKFSLDYLD